MNTIELSSFIKRAFHLQMNFIESIVKGVFANIKSCILLLKVLNGFAITLPHFVHHHSSERRKMSTSISK